MARQELDGKQLEKVAGGATLNTKQLITHSF